MAVSWISPLGVEECKARLEEAGKTDSITYSVRGRSFTLQMREGRSEAYLRGEFSEAPPGTVVTYSTGTNSSSGQFASLWFKIGLPIFLLFVAALFLNGYVNGFTRNVLFSLVLAVAVSAAFSVLKLRDMGLARSEQKELLAFLEAALKGRPDDQR